MGESQDLTEPVLLRVTASKELGYAKKVASAMLWRLRDCEGYCKARTMKETATNTAIKAVAICNQRVTTAAGQASDLVIGVDLRFSRPEGATAIDMLIGDVGVGTGKIRDYKVSGKDGCEINAKLAEAICGACLEGDRVALKCIGPSAVYRAVIASTIAKGTLFASGLSSVIVPTWGSFPSTTDGDRPISFINIEFRSFLEGKDSA